MTQSPLSSPASPKLSLLGATLVGVASMLGAGVFVVFAPAYALAGSYLLVSIVVAGLVASLNARSTRQLAKVLPKAGGSYAYGREYISLTWGFLAGVAFIVGKIGSVAAIALAAASYLFPDAKVEVAITAVAVMTGINLLGINKTALGALLLSTPTVTLLMIVGFAGLEIENATPATNFSLSGVLAASALLFFAFAGYARVATLGEEVKNPSANVPRAIVIGLVFVLGIYLLVGNALQRGLGQSLGLSVAPIRDFVQTQISWLPSEVVIVVATGACLGSLLSLLAGISRTAEAMADDRELPKAISRRSKRFHSPWVAELLIAAIATILLLSGDIVWTIGLSSFCILLYYAIGNLAAFRQLGQTRLFSRFLALVGLATCFILAVLVPLHSLLIGSLLLASALVIRSGLIKFHSSN